MFSAGKQLVPDSNITDGLISEFLKYNSRLLIFPDPQKDTTEYNVRLANTAFILTAKNCNNTMNAKNGNDQYEAKKLVKNHGHTHRH